TKNKYPHPCIEPRAPTIKIKQLPLSNQNPSFYDTPSVSAVFSQFLLTISKVHLYYDYANCIKCRTINTNNKLSTLSSTPPCPGKIFPKSFISKCLFIAEATKSPIRPTIDMMNEIIII